MFGDLGMQTPAQFYEYFNDFSTYAAGDWTVTAATGTSALADAVGGKLLQTTGAVDNDIQANSLTKKTFGFTSGQDVWFGINFALGMATGATGSDFAAGLANSFATPTSFTDGVWFSKPQNSTTLSLKVAASSTASTFTVGTVASATAYTVGFFYNGSAQVPVMYVFSTIPFAAGTLTKPSPYFPGGNYVALTAGAGLTNLLTNLPATSTVLTLGFGLQAGGAQAQTNTVDYVFGGQTINRY